MLGINQKQSARKGIMATIDIYYAQMCGLCHQAMDYLTGRGIPFNAHEVKWDPEAGAFEDSETSRELYRRCGETVDVVPQIFINGRHVAGWRGLEPLIESGEFDNMIKEG